MAPANANGPSGVLGDAGARVARLIFYSLLAITLMALDHRGRYVDQVRSVASNLVEPALLLIETPFVGFRRLADDMGLKRDLAGQVAALEQARLMESARLGLVEELLAENAELRELLGASERLGQRYHPAELLGVDLDPFAHRVLVKRGRVDGIEAGRPVLDAGGLVGQVEEVYRHTARVILLSDPDHALPVRVQRTGLRTIAYGTGSINELALKDLAMNVDLEAGDLLATSGLGGHFPPGLPVARVVSVERTPGKPFATARAEPLAYMDRNRHVLIVETLEPEPAVSDAPADPDAGGGSPDEAPPVEPDAPEPAGEEADP